MVSLEAILGLIASSDHPVEIRFSERKVTRAMIRAQVQEMTEPELARFIVQIGERFQHGTLTASKDDGKLIVKWEQTVIVGERR